MTYTTARFHPPRRPTHYESVVLALLLSPEFPGAVELREQARSAVVSETFMGDDGFTITFVVSGPRAPNVRESVPVEASTVTELDQGRTSLLLHVLDGHLRFLECFQYAGKVTKLPAVEALEVWVPPPE